VNDETTDKLLREFLLKQRVEEKRKFDENLALKQHVSNNTDTITKAFQSFSQQLTARFDTFETDQKVALENVKKTAETAHQLAMGVAARVGVLEGTKGLVAAQRAVKVKMSIPPASPPVWDLGEESPTGTHHIIPIEAFKTSKEEWSVFLKEELVTHEKLRDGDTWRWLKENATKVFVAVIATVIASAIIATVIVNAQKPTSSPPAAQH
jgi:hypothetical protein